MVFIIMFKNIPSMFNLFNKFCSSILPTISARYSSYIVYDIDYNSHFTTSESEF